MEGEERDYLVIGPHNEQYEIRARSSEKARWVAVKRYIQENTTVGLKQTNLAIAFEVRIKNRRIPGTSPDKASTLRDIARQIVYNSEAYKTKKKGV